MSGPSAEDLRARIVGRLKWACEHFQDDPECAELTAAGLEEFFQVDLAAKDAEIARLAEENTTLVGQLADHRATLKRLTDLTSQYADRAIENGQRAEQLAAELEQWRACFGETALKDARKVLAERDRLRAAAERVREIHQPVPCSNMRHDGGNGQHCGVCEYDDIGGNIWPCPTIRALDQAPAAEQDGGGE